MTDINVEFGQRIKQLRTEQNISQEELGFRSQLSKNYISDVERGRRNVTLKVVQKLAEGLDVSLMELFRVHD